MPYAVAADLQRLSLPAAALTGISTADQDAALEAASDLADSYLKTRFKIPLITWQDDLRRAVTHIAGYDLMVRRGYNPEAGADPNIRLRYEDAIRWLKYVALGTVSPDIKDSSAAGTLTQAAPELVTNARRGW
jgi:phage gp36-like protein